jgi:glycosyltransferase involved in cell wall biosynthesis
MPAYNEAENIENVVRQWYGIVEKLGGILAVFDDGSKDDTYGRMQRMAQDMPLFSPQTKANSGHGATILYAYKWALEHGADYVFQTDSDGQTLPEEFWQFWEQRSSHDIIVGVRSGRQDGMSRIAVTKILRWLLLVIFGVWVKDSNTPFRLMSKGFLQKALTIVPADFFLANVAISVIARRQKQRMLWLPITFMPRQAGVNSINLRRIVKIGIKAIADFRMINKKISM